MASQRHPFTSWYTCLQRRAEFPPAGQCPRSFLVLDFLDVVTSVTGLSFCLGFAICFLFVAIGLILHDFSAWCTVCVYMPSLVLGAVPRSIT